MVDTLIKGSSVKKFLLSLFVICSAFALNSYAAPLSPPQDKQLLLKSAQDGQVPAENSMANQDT